MLRGASFFFCGKVLSKRYVARRRHCTLYLSCINMDLKKIAVAITGASGAIYAKLLLQQLNVLKDQCAEVSVVMTTNAKQVWQTELGNTDFENIPFRFFEKMDFMAPFASGSAQYDAVIIIPCSMGTLGRIASGFSDD